MECATEVSADELELIRSAFRGAVDTVDGAARFYVDLETLALEHVDTAEAIWSADADGKLKESGCRILADLNNFDDCINQSIVDLAILHDSHGLNRLKDAFAGSDDKRALWVAFEKKVIEPYRRMAIKHSPSQTSLKNPDS
ncbi:hypothetical protein EUZ85_15995 [Hahella sp. KA22]|uniref:hypothetical protein n=1 Tax=Hahella sp. KA22 TaxID=1628392 RepID=UPI000FDE4CAF|nr:hypothetical protein [Hahella sp. KA22]AZZ92145.1 hypothetical protein ENC22_13430 [Hahella sp. KA22]QAY55516.1 hypothetical protein EUZ85_15995 [Hahella sp. KA22]